MICQMPECNNQAERGGLLCQGCRDCIDKQWEKRRASDNKAEPAESYCEEDNEDRFSVG